METKFNIIYVIRFFNGASISGIVELVSTPVTTKNEIEFKALSIVRNHRNRESKGAYSIDRWMDHVQKIDLTVTQIQ